AVGGDVASLVELQPKPLDPAVAYGPEEAHRQQHQIRLNGEVAARDRFKRGWRPHSNRMNAPDIAALVALEPNAVDGPIADAAFFVAALSTQLQRPQRPRGRSGAALRRLGHDLELVHALCPLPQTGAQTIGAG